MQNPRQLHQQMLQQINYRRPMEIDNNNVNRRPRSNINCASSFQIMTICLTTVEASSRIRHVQAAQGCQRTEET